MPRGRKSLMWTPERIEELRQLAVEGKTIDYIARYFGEAFKKPISLDNVYQQCHKRGIELAGRQKSRLNSKIVRLNLKHPDMATRIRLLLGEEISEDRPRREFTDEQLSKFINSIDVFCKEVLDIELQDYQRDMVALMEAHKRAVFITGRQVGKDWTAAVYSIWKCITRPNFKIVLISAAQRQSDQLMERILSFVARSREVYDAVHKPTMEELRFTNNSRIYALSATGLIRGYTEVDLAIINEARDIPDIAYDAVFPMLSVKNGAAAIMSTPLKKAGRLWQAFNDPLFGKLQLPTRLNKYIPANFLQKEREGQSALMYAVEYEAQFADEVSSFFDSQLVLKTMRDYDMVMAREDWKKYALGIDWGRVRDSSVFTVISKDDSGFLRLEYVKELKNMPFPEQLAFIHYLNNTFKFETIVGEYAGLGIPPTEQLIADNLPVYKFKPTAGEKLKAYDWLKRTMEASQVAIPATANKLLTELRMFQFKVSGDKILLHHVAGGSDDFADSFCYGVWAFKAGDAMIHPLIICEKLPV